MPPCFWVWNRGFRYQINRPRLQVKPDFLLRKYCKCIFVNRPFVEL
nr:hypothetical protein [Hallella bergensis]